MSNNDSVYNDAEKHDDFRNAYFGVTDNVSVLVDVVFPFGLDTPTFCKDVISPRLPVTLKIFTPDFILPLTKLEEAYRYHSLSDSQNNTYVLLMANALKCALAINQ